MILTKMLTTKIHNIIALDVGDKRVGIALTNTLAKLPRPYRTIVRDESFWNNLEQIIADEEVQEIVVGIPRNLSSNDTPQTTITKQFIDELTAKHDIPVQTIDEALTSSQAEKELLKRGKKFAKGYIDALAAVYILEDYLKSGV